MVDRNAASCQHLYRCQSIVLREAHTDLQNGLGGIHDRSPETKIEWLCCPRCGGKTRVQIRTVKQKNQNARRLDAVQTEKLVCAAFIILWEKGEKRMKNNALVVIGLQNDITKNYREIIENVNRAIDWAV